MPEKFERARRIREQAEMFAAMGRLESIESVMGEIRAYRQAAARDKDYAIAIRGCDVALSALALVAARPATQDVQGDAFYDVNPSKPLDLARLAQLNEVIRQREGGTPTPPCPPRRPASRTPDERDHGGGCLAIMSQGEVVPLDPIVVRRRVGEAAASRPAVGRLIWITDYPKLRPVCGLRCVVSSIGPAAPGHAAPNTSYSQ